jgi:predicted nucleic acid-binding protein
MIVVIDSSPVIFLGKVQCLDLVSHLLGGSLLVPEEVLAEVLVPNLPPAEERTLRAFFAQCDAVKVRRPRRLASGLSRADHAALNLAIRRSPATLLADDHLVREVARLERVPAVGTLGVLLRACRAGLLDTNRAQALVDDLIRQHHFRISIEVYQAVQRELLRP